MAPFVTGEVNPAALDDLVRLCVELDRLRHYPRTGNDGGDSAGQDHLVSAAQEGVGASGTGGADVGHGAPGPDTARAWEALERAIIGKTTILLLHSSGPGHRSCPRPAARDRGPPRWETACPAIPSGWSPRTGRRPLYPGQVDPGLAGRRVRHPGARRAAGDAPHQRRRAGVGGGAEEAEEGARAPCLDVQGKAAKLVAGVRSWPGAAVISWGLGARASQGGSLVVRSVAVLLCGTRARSGASDWCRRTQVPFAGRGRHWRFPCAPR